MTLHQLTELLSAYDKKGYSNNEVRCATAHMQCMWVFVEDDKLVLKTALDFDADDLKTYAEEYYMSGKSPYADDEAFAEHLLESGISQQLVRDALGEAWSVLYFKVVAKRLERKGSPIMRE